MRTHLKKKDSVPKTESLSSISISHCFHCWILIALRSGLHLAALICEEDTILVFFSRFVHTLLYLLPCKNRIVIFFFWLLKITFVDPEQNTFKIIFLDQWISLSHNSQMKADFTISILFNASLFHLLNLLNFLNLKTSMFLQHEALWLFLHLEYHEIFLTKFE